MTAKKAKNHAINILFIYVNEYYLNLFRYNFNFEEYNFKYCTYAQLEFEKIATLPPALILLEVSPTINIIESLSTLRRVENIPFIVFSTFSNLFKQPNLLNQIDDYITDPYDFNEIKFRLDKQIKLQKRPKNLKLKTKIQSFSPTIYHETKEQNNLQEKLQKISYYDPLTGVINRYGFVQQLEQQLNKIKQESVYKFAIIACEINNFKHINYSLGREIGDCILKSIADCLQSCLNTQDSIARFEAGEFNILLTSIQKITAITNLIEKIQAKLSLPFKINQQEIILNFNLGVVLGTPQYKTTEQLLHHVGLATYQAKSLGRGRYQIYEEKIYQSAIERLRLEAAINQAIKNQEFLLYYQPIICLRTGYLLGFESLIRWQRPQLGIVSPCEFIPIAEESGAIIPLGIWVLKEACHQLQIWRKKYPSFSSLTISVNVSTQQFSHGNLVEIIDEILQENQLPGECLKLEITESAIMTNTNLAKKTLQQLKDRNIQISIDDFGTGYSSLSYLHQFPLDNLKIDRSFIQRIENINQTYKIIDVIVDLAHNLGMTITAEGIETHTQLEYLKNINCEYGQGYYFSEPLDVLASTQMGLMIGEKELAR